MMLMQRTRTLLEEAPPEARAVANMCWAATRLQGCLSSQLTSLQQSLDQAVRVSANQMNAQEVANMIWTLEKRYAEGSDSDSEASLGLLLLLAGRLPSVISAMNAQAVSNVIWTSAKLAATDPDANVFSGLLPLLAGRVPYVISDMNAQGVANAVWAIAKLSATGTDAEALLGTLPVLAGRVPAVTKQMNTQHVANVMWATGQLSQRHASRVTDIREVLPIIVDQAVAVIRQATPQALANSCWGLALSLYSDTGFLQAVATRVVDEADGWHSRGAELTLPSLLCAFARLKAAGYEDMLDGACTRLAPMLTQINDWGLCTLSWSYHELDLNDNFLPFRQRLEEEVLSRGFSKHDVERSFLGPETWRTR
ncbi:unnamed protein product [Effrenium voratum]|nr:unnamed protein product [Effrenium voratum]